MSNYIITGFQGQKHTIPKNCPYRKTDQSAFMGWYNQDAFMLLIKPTR